MNLNGNDDNEIRQKYLDYNLYAYQESIYDLSGKTKINTIILDEKGNRHKGTENFEKLWKHYFPWLVFSKNYFSEYKNENGYGRW